MRHFTLALFAICLTFNTAPTFSDFPFGADTLPFLARNSSAIVVVGDASPWKQTESGSAWVCHVALDSVLTGEASTEPINLARLSAGRQPKDLKGGSVVFLGPKLSPRANERHGVAAEKPSFTLVGGDHGVIRSEDAVAFVREFLQLETPGSRAQWAMHNLASEDVWRQRSALYTALGVGRPMEAELAWEVLEEAARQDTAALLVREQGLRELVAREAPQSLEVLRDVATDPAAPQALRVGALEQMYQVEGGIAALRELSSRDDRFLSPYTNYLLHTKENEERGWEEWASLPNQLGSLEVQAIVTVIVDTKRSPEERYSLLQSLANDTGLEAIKGLATALRDESLPSSMQDLALEGLEQTDEDLLELVGDEGLRSRLEELRDENTTSIDH